MLCAALRGEPVDRALLCRTAFFRALASFGENSRYARRMSQADLAFWSTAAQISVVLALAMTIEYARTFNGTHPDRGWRSFKGFASTQVLIGTVTIGTAFIMALYVLNDGHSTTGQKSLELNDLILGFIVVVVAPALALIVRIWRTPGDPNNPEPRKIRKPKRSKNRPAEPPPPPTKTED